MFKTSFFDSINDEDFNYEKVMKLAKDLKNGKHNPLRNKTNSVKIRNVEGISKYDMDYLTHELNNNLTSEERKKKYIKRPVGDYIYKVKNNGFNDYEYIERVQIDEFYN